MNHEQDKHASQQASPDAIERISAAMTRNRLMTRRRIIGRLAIAKVAPALEVSHLDVLDAVRRASTKGDATIGIVAESMRIDPSRASRIVAEMVSEGVLERRVCQSDARRTVLVMTERGGELVQEIRKVKRELLHSITDSWPKEDVEVFARLYERFIAGLEQRTGEYSAQQTGAKSDDSA
ncbi:winged helix-turn-helix transcriptional regulator [Martelella alba]|uniref:Winged helix-turn-helix transcriptional regulator n=1 Tax=Martelella alba TaxID=2590451 RepID=A0A506UGK5_9HYPH|nr:MarR family winged helix-turn-helix transcriptional regulator [Martelella alba]TPW32515.1 winged helix-turn-helix transcriptional regulator [Martelella alba]